MAAEIEQRLRAQVVPQVATSDDADPEPVEPVEL
jgi:hypothetical protein